MNLSRSVKVRIIAFVLLSALGIVYITASYLGFVDRILGRGITVTATLPTSGGLFEGSEVTYRGVKIGKVSKMTATRDGISLQLKLQEGTKLPVDAPMYVHNLSAVGEQYLDFEPPDDEGPYAEEGTTLAGNADSMPVDEGDLLVTIDAFVNSVDKRNLQVVVAELGDMFQGTGPSLQTMLDQGGTFVDTAYDHTEETKALLDDGLVVLRTQQGQRENIKSFARDLALITRSLKESDGDLRGVLQGTPGAAVEIDKLLRDLEPTLPVLLGNAISINQMMVTHLDGLEQLLVIFPRTIAGGFTGTTPDGYGHVNLQYDNAVPPCTQGYMPSSQWRPPSDLTDSAIFPAQCKAGPPYVMRGTRYAPGNAGNPSAGRLYRSSYDPMTGQIAGIVDADGDPVLAGQQGNLSILGDDAWKWLLVGPVAGQ
jgi:phospholipid/cholesterol/gamma-HCH transport system substrate-binding protein